MRRSTWIRGSFSKRSSRLSPFLTRGYWRAHARGLMMPMLQEEAEKRKLAGVAIPKDNLLGVRPQGSEDNQISQIKGKASEIAGKAVGVHERTVRKALAEKRADPKEFERIRRDDGGGQR
jgi:hypothetical protein